MATAGGRRGGRAAHTNKGQERIMSGLMGALGGLMQGGGTAGGAGNMLSEAFNAAGGVSGIMSKFQQAGMGDKVQSWAGSGSNLPLAAEEVERVFPPQQIEAWAEAHGVPAGAASALLAHLLPHAVDSQTPNGQAGVGAGGGSAQADGDDPFADGRASDAPDTDSYNATQASGAGGASAPGSPSGSSSGSSSGQGFDFGGLVQRLMGGNR
jgi:uncharacterized protein YidB (DUF937 family)